MDKRLIAGVLVFGSLWGFSEVIIGTGLQNANLPYGQSYFSLIDRRIVIGSNFYGNRLCNLPDGKEGNAHLWGLHRAYYRGYSRLGGIS